ncbi:MAG: S-adenosylmethionine:tRNA ribosyltransferase-isomerase [Hyphomicrobiaceae bacterium hypho_1]
MRTDLFDFNLPEDRIALWPKEPRDLARLLVLDRDEVRDMCFKDLASELNSGDILVFNDTRVIPAALNGERERGNKLARISVNLHKRSDDASWLVFARPARKIKLHDRLIFRNFMRPDLSYRLNATVLRKADSGEIELKFDLSGAELDIAIQLIGAAPLPPYIISKRAICANDLESYQTIYSKHEGAVAAPTAGLHFTENVFKSLSVHDIRMAYLTLHVGAGTFIPVNTKDIENHYMHSEWGEISQEVASQLNTVRESGGRLIAVGTTVARLLETAALTNGKIQPFQGYTNIFISPGHRFRAIDGLITNFHLPKSTLFMLVSAFAGHDRICSAYNYAIAEGYRFYSYGDASLLWPINHDP